MDDDVQEAIRLSLQQSATDSGTSNRCAAATPSTLLGILGDQPKIGQSKDQAKVLATPRALPSKCADATPASLQPHGSPKSTVAVAVPTPDMPIHATVPSLPTNNSYVSTNNTPPNIASNATTFDKLLPLLELKTAAHSSVSKNRHQDALAELKGARNTKKCKRKRKKRKRNSYKHFMADALRPKRTRTQKMQVHLETIKLSLGGGQIPKLDRL